MESRTWIHKLTPGLVETLRKFGLTVKTKGRNAIHIRNDITLDITANNNFQKLKYWGLVAKYKENGIHLAGYWVLTKNGGTFLRNEIEMPKKVKTCDNRLIEKSQETCRITDFYQGYPEDYWQREFSFDFSQESLFGAITN